MPGSRLTAEDRRRQIIETAAEVFSIRGVEGTRIRDISKACGINEALIYRHFESKDNLYHEAMAYIYGEAAGKLNVVGMEQESGLEGLTEVLRVQLDVFAKNSVLSANLWHGVASTTHDEVMRDEINFFFDQYQQNLQKLIKKGIDDGSIRDDMDPDLGAWIVRGLAWPCILRSMVDTGAGEISCTSESYSEILRRIFASESDL